MDNFGEMTETFNSAKALRIHKYPDLLSESNIACQEFASYLDSLKQDGFVILEDFFPSEAISEIRATMDLCIRQGRNISTPKRLVGAEAWDPDARNTHLSPYDLAAGPDQYRSSVNYVDIKDPLINIPQLIEIVFHDTILNIAAAYLECFPALGFIKMRRSFSNALQEYDTNLFHFDGNSLKVFKAFVYLNNVDPEGGPTTFIRGSHENRFPGWDIADRYSYDQISLIYGEDKIEHLTAKAGDLVLADASGCHRGTKPVARDRDIIILNYVLHPEYSFVDGILTNVGGSKSKITKSDYDSLSERHAAAADLLEVV